MTCAKTEMRPLLLLAMVSPLFYWLSSGQNGFFTTYLRYSRSCFSLFILIVGGAERSFHNLIHGVQEATPQQ